MVPGIIPGMAGQTGPTVTYLGRAGNSLSSSSYSFTSQPLGTSSPTRLIVVAFSGVLGAGFSYSSSNIAGIAGTYVVGSSVTSGSANVHTIMTQAIVPTGSTGTIQVTWNKPIARCAISLWAIDGILSSSSVNSTIGLITGAGGTIPLSMNVQVNDVIICALTAFNTDLSMWVGVSEQYDASFGTSQHSGGSEISSVAASPRTISATIGGTAAACAAMWR